MSFAVPHRHPRRTSWGRARTARLAVLVAAAAAAVSMPSVASAGVLDLGGPSGDAVKCRVLVPGEAPCLLPIGPPAATGLAVTNINAGPLDPSQVYVARRVSDGNGLWAVGAPKLDGDHWRPRPDGSIETAFRLEPGDQLVLANPLVVGGSTAALEVPFGEKTVKDKLYDGQMIAARAIGQFRMEPDADGDGWGDESQDLCPGVNGPLCAGAKPKLDLAAPNYVPSTGQVQATFTVTNVGAAPQPFVLDLYANTSDAPTVVAGGAQCRPGRIDAPQDAIIAPAARSPLIPASAPAGATVTHLSAPLPEFGYGPTAPAPGAVACQLPLLMPGQSMSGTITGHSWVESTRARFDGALLGTTSGTAAPGQVRATKTVAHFRAGVVSPDLRPILRSTDPINRKGVVLVQAGCRGPQVLPGCTLSVELRTSLRGTVLGKSTQSRKVPDADDEATLKVALSARGRRWFKSHHGRALIVIRAVRPGETEAVTAVRLKLARSAAFKRRLAQLH